MMDEFDVYFQRARQDEEMGELQQATFRAPSLGKAGRRGSVPSIVTSQEPSFYSSHKRTLSCRAPRRNVSSLVHKASKKINKVLEEDSSGDVISTDEGVVAKPRRNVNPRLEKELESLKAKPQVTKQHDTLSKDDESLKKRNPRLVKELDTLKAKSQTVKAQALEDLNSNGQDRLLEEDICVVRSFKTSPRGLIKRGDSVKRKRNKTQEKLNTLDTLPEAKCESQAPTKSSAKSKSKDYSHRVLFIGDKIVGKTALINQLLSSEHIGAPVDISLGKSVIKRKFTASM